jgi:hypothetical protein
MSPLAPAEAEPETISMAPEDDVALPVPMIIDPEFPADVAVCMLRSPDLMAPLPVRALIAPPGASPDVSPATM